MTETTAPEDIVTLADERSAARSARDWAGADELKARIEAAGWRIVDSGTAYSLAPARPPDLVEAGQTFYGAVDSVPSRLEEAATASATIMVIAETGGCPVDPALESLAAHRSAGRQVLVVADREAVIGGPADEIIRSLEPWSAGDALGAALRRATGEIIVVIEPELQVRGDIVGPLVDGLRDPAVAVIGTDGLVSVDLRRYQPAGTDGVTTVGSGCYAFRRGDLIAKGAVDARLQLRGSVAAWLGLLLRDEGADAPPRRAVVIELPVTRVGERAYLPDDHVRHARRDSYRIAECFRQRSWLAAEEPRQRRLVGEGPQGHEHDDDAHHSGDAG